jgi:protein phosphatase-4 regulatory subunit 3
MLGREVSAIAQMEWSALEEQMSNGEPAKETTAKTPPPPPSPSPLSESNKDSSSSPSKAESQKDPEDSISWKQHLAPQDGSLASRLIRRKGALSFFRELFNMVRVSLQQGDKDDFYAAIVNMEVDLDKEKESGSVNLLSLLASVLADPSADVAEKGAVLEIIAAIAMHDPSLIRRQCLELHEVWKKEEGERMACPGRPNPNDVKQVRHVLPGSILRHSLDIHYSLFTFCSSDYVLL